VPHCRRINESRSVAVPPQAAQIAPALQFVNDDCGRPDARKAAVAVVPQLTDTLRGPSSGG
jgi:hypothetical protein